MLIVAAAVVDLLLIISNVMMYVVVQILMLSFHVFAQPGFHQPTDVSLSSRVYQIWTLRGDLKSGKAELVEEKNYLRFLENLNLKSESLFTDKAYSRGWRELAAVQLFNCAKASEHQCLIQLSMGMGTGFTLNDGHKFVTVLHNFQWEISVRKSALVNPPLLILDRKDEILFSSRDRLNKVFENSVFSPAIKDIDDFTVIDLPVSLPYLVSATDGCGVGSAILNLGYPIQTINRKTYGYGDSSGDGLWATRGVVLGKEIAREKIKSNRDLWPPGTENQALMFSDADLERGMSGGPILNSRGEVCGLLSSGMYKMFGGFSVGPLVSKILQAIQ